MLDWYLPFMNGQGFLEHLERAVARLPPVLVLTGDVHVRKSTGISEVLVKPVSLDVLIERVAALSGQPQPSVGAAGAFSARA